MRELNVCGVLVVRGDPIEAFLLLNRPGQYDIPKGHVDPGESEVECALRELQEETAITPRDIDLDTRFRFTASIEVESRKFNNEICRKSLVIFLGRLLRDVAIVPTEHSGYEWRPWSPPHQVQEKMIDPLLASLADYVAPSSVSCDP
jgi:bis(5'-nucleosidyl)-tetraphosphatase